MTTTSNEPVKHTLDIGFGDATQGLTGYEVFAIEKHFGRGTEDLHSIELMVGTVWAYESRNAEKPVSWTIPCNMTVKQLRDYFAPDDDDAAGKDPTSPGDTPEASPDGAWPPASDPTPTTG
jgi:hypothetical protein